MSRLAPRLAAVIGTVLAVVLLGAGPARAGGPTSVLVVNYDGARAAAALTGSTTYDALARALDVAPGEQPPGDPSAPAEFMGTELRLVWLIHDVTPWRVDALRFDHGTIWVNTVVSWDGDLMGRSGTWHRPHDEALLRSTLASLGVLPSGKPGATAPVPDEVAQAANAPQGGAAPAASRPPTTPSTGGLPPWVLGPLALTMLGVGLAAGRFMRRPSSAPSIGATGAQRESAGPPEPDDPATDDPQGAPGARSAAYDEPGRTPVERFTLR